MVTTDVELMLQMKQLYDPAASPFEGDESPYAAFSWESSAGTPDQSLDNSPYSSKFTWDDDEIQAHAFDYDQISQASVQETAPGAQSTKPGLNLNAKTFVPGRFVEHGYFPPPRGTPETWLEYLDAGMLSSDPKLPPLLVHSCSWTSNTLCDLAQLFCWEILAKANIVDFGPEAARFAREVHKTLATDHSDSEWLSSSFAFHLQQYAFKHFKSIWCSHDNLDAISQRNKIEIKRWNVALEFSCFVADLFSFGLIQTPIMHQCLGILLHEMVSVQHVCVIQAMVKRAGPTLWQTADSHQRRQEFIRCFVQRIRSLSDNASLTGREETIRKVIKADNIIPLINEWHARRPECPPPAVKSIWGLAGLNELRS